MSEMQVERVVETVNKDRGRVRDEDNVLSNVLTDYIVRRDEYHLLF